MRVYLDFLGLPDLLESIGSKGMQLELKECTVRDVLNRVSELQSDRARKIFFDEDGNLNMAIQILLNGRALIGRDHLDKRLHQGDTVTVMRLVAGG